ncbi:unnamed protein product (macronuclear) [Paramecium tetraurelia]|uniref:DNA repair nuclease/redox regulator APEX1 n=1 Tax=Paramecium tetraurelia TaxID=5888 RepID=A0DRN1_PARTE|nr:uncharacterized protein GSPATT00019416001 [Paramecium tetraurelia]CAK85698.1 unnamed protein product [Paramecium tetraurelia]|eukprot:XP_001453095.1 hypothetical protein (macronuclear) [Paramecium tetraurelia strain d4-2]
MDQKKTRQSKKKQSPEKKEEVQEKEVVKSKGKQQKGAKNAGDNEDKKGEQKIEKQQVVKGEDKKAKQVQQGDSKFELGDGRFSTPTVKIASWNVNGIRAATKREQAVKYLQDTKFDVICLNELKADQAVFDKENLGAQFGKHYFLYLNFCKNKGGYSGVAIASKVKPISVKCDIGISKHDQEGRTLTAEYERFYLVACYVPNAGQKLERLDYRTKEWDVDFQNYLEDLRKKKPTILCGDLNVSHHEIDLANPAGNKKTAGFTQEERDQFTNYLQKGWVDSFRHLHPKEVKYSYFSARFNSKQSNKGWRLDYFIINKESTDAIIMSDINTAVEGSDHVPIECEVDLRKL